MRQFVFNDPTLLFLEYLRCCVKPFSDVVYVVVIPDGKGFLRKPSEGSVVYNYNHGNISLGNWTRTFSAGLPIVYVSLPQASRSRRGITMCPHLVTWVPSHRSPGFTVPPKPDGTSCDRPLMISNLQYSQVPINLVSSNGKSSDMEPPAYVTTTFFAIFCLVHVLWLGISISSYFVFAYLNSILGPVRQYLLQLHNLYLSPTWCRQEVLGQWSKLFVSINSVLFTPLCSFLQGFNCSLLELELSVVQPNCALIQSGSISLFFIHVPINLTALAINFLQGSIYWYLW